MPIKAEEMKHMNEVNKTLYIPLYGKSSVSKKGIILKDPKAELIWEKEGFPLKGKAKSKWLTYYMGMPKQCWYDVDFESVIEERKKYYKETEHYHMLVADASKPAWIGKLPTAEHVIVVMEGVSMYLKRQELVQLFVALDKAFSHVHLLMDCYTEFAAKASKYKNPINEVGAHLVYGLDEPKYPEQQTDIRFIAERDMTPDELIGELRGFEKVFFKCVLGGNLSKKMYRLYEYEK